MEFIETKIFTEEISQLATDTDYKEIQKYLCSFPLVGDVKDNLTTEEKKYLKRLVEDFENG